MTCTLTPSLHTHDCIYTHIMRVHTHDCISLGPRPKPTPAQIASSITRVILEAIRAGVGLGLWPKQLMHMHTHSCICTHLMHIHAHLLHMHTHLCICTHLMHIHAHLLHMHTHLCICTHLMHMHTHTSCICTHLMHMHTHIVEYLGHCWCGEI